MIFLDYIKAELLILIPVLYTAGLGLKKSKLQDNKIPLCLGILSVVLCIIWVLATSDVTSVRNAAAALFSALTQGILLAGASVYANQIYKQKNKE